MLIRRAYRFGFEQQNGIQRYEPAYAMTALAKPDVFL